MKLLPAHRTFLIINQVVVSTLFNFLLNATIAWILFRNVSSIPLWGGLSIGVDTAVTAFILPMATCYTIALSIWFALSHNMLPAIEKYPTTGIIYFIIKKPVIVQGLLHGVAGVLLLGAPVLLWFIATGTTSLSFQMFLLFKATFAALLSLVVAPVIGLFALFGSAPRKDSI